MGDHAADHLDADDRSRLLIGGHRQDRKVITMAERADRLWSVQDVVDCLGIPRKTLYQWRHHGVGPRARRVGRYRRYEERDVRDWFASLDDGAAQAPSMPRLPIPVGSFGTITRVHLPDGTWQARTHMHDLDGERRLVARRGRSAAAAERALKAALAERTAPARSALGPSTPVREVAERWYAGIQAAEVEAGDKSPNTARLYRHYLDRHILPGVGALRLGEAGVARLDGFVTAVRARSGAGAAKACGSALSGIMGYAARHGAIPANPVRDIGRLPGARRGVRARSLTLAECRRWIAQLEADQVAVRRDLPDLTRWFLATGVRIGEAIAVDWSAIDMDRGLVEIAYKVIG